MSQIFHIALNTFKETIRNKVLYNILFFALAIIFLSISFGDWSVFARTQVMADFGLATMSLTGLLLAVFIGAGILGRELSNKTVYNILAQPVSRTCFVVGKFCGLLLTLVVNYMLMAAVFLGVYSYMGGAIDVMLLAAVVLALAELSIVVSVSILFSTFSTPVLSAIFTLAFYVAGHYNDLLEIAMIERRNPVFAIILRGIYYLFPNLAHFNVRALVVYGNGVGASYVAYALIYGILYTALFVFLGTLVFSRKDL